MSRRSMNEDSYYEDSQYTEGNDYDDNDGFQDSDYAEGTTGEEGESYYEEEEEDYEEEEAPAPYQDQPYDPKYDTGQGMMAYDETIEDDPAYDYDPNEEYYDEDEEGTPMVGDYYEDEEGEAQYYDEDEEERRRRARRRRAWCCCLMLLCCLLILIILLIIFLIRLRSGDDIDETPAPTFAPFVDETDDDYYYDDDIILAPGAVTTYMAPVDLNCDFDDQDPMFANVWDQCNCDGEISVVPDDVAQMRQLILDRMHHKFYTEDTVFPLSSCDPQNMALIWLAAGNNRDAGEPRQRYALAVSYFGLNGTIWDYGDEWLGELNECLWLGVQCNNRDTVNSFAIDTNNVFGQVRSIT